MIPPLLSCAKKPIPNWKNFSNTGNCFLRPFVTAFDCLWDNHSPSSAKMQAFQQPQHPALCLRLTSRQAPMPGKRKHTPPTVCKTVARCASRGDPPGTWWEQVPGKRGITQRGLGTCLWCGSSANRGALCSLQAHFRSARLYGVSRQEHNK